MKSIRCSQVYIGLNQEEMSSIPVRKGIAAHVSLLAVFWNRIVIRKGCNGKLCDEGTQLHYFLTFCVGIACRNLEDRSHATHFRQ